MTEQRTSSGATVGHGLAWAACGAAATITMGWLLKWQQEWSETAALTEEGPATASQVSLLIKQRRRFDRMWNDSMEHSVWNDLCSIFPKDYTGSKPPREHVAVMLDAANWAPTHVRVHVRMRACMPTCMQGKTEPWRFVVFSDGAIGRCACLSAHMHISMHTCPCRSACLCTCLCTCILYTCPHTRI